MLRFAFACVLSFLGFSCCAHAGVKVAVKNVNYSIKGSTGASLLEQMDRYGPKHGLLARAIAQTSYAVEWNLDWAVDNGRCRVKKANATLAITYTYPKVSGAVPQDVQRRWGRFMVGVRRHEETHGRIARDMVVQAERALSRLAFDNDASCSKTRQAVKRRVSEIYAQFEARQISFDKNEHHGGGNVDRLVSSLMGKRKQ